MIRINKANAVFVNASNEKDGKFIGFVGGVNDPELNEYTLKVNSGNYAPVAGHIRLRKHDNGEEWAILIPMVGAGFGYGSDNIIRS